MDGHICLNGCRLGKQGHCFGQTRPELCSLLHWENTLLKMDVPPAPVKVQVPEVVVPDDAYVIDPLTFVTMERLVQDTKIIARLAPHDVDMIVAISRSGLLPGSQIAYYRHLPLWTVSRHTGIGNPGHGVRLENKPFVEPRHILLVDDTAASGREMSACLSIVQESFLGAKITRAVVYSTPRALPTVDLYAAVLDGLHYLAWNWATAGHGARCGFDFDGIICRDEDHTQPLYLPRRTVVPMIVTGRHESVRGMTAEWLDRWGVRYDRLIMRDFGAPEDYTGTAEFKARHYAESDCELFAESDPTQAQVIATITGRPVLCPVLGRVLHTPQVMPHPDPAPPKKSRRVKVSELSAADRRKLGVTGCGCGGKSTR